MFIKAKGLNILTVQSCIKKTFFFINDKKVSLVGPKGQNKETKL